MDYLAVVLLISLGACLADSEFENNTEKSTNKFTPENELDEYLNNVTAIFDRNCPECSIKLQELKDLAPLCYNNINIINNESMCSSAQRFLDECVSPTTTSLEKYLKGDSKSLPQFLINVTHSLNEHICELKAKYLLELANPCYKQGSLFFLVMESKVKSVIRKYNESDELPSKNDLCNDLLDLKPIVVKQFTTRCFNPVTREALNGFVEAILRPCSNANQVP